MNPRGKLRQLAPCATVGIGGAPSRDLALEFDLPTLPELVVAGETLRGAQPSSWRWFVEQLRGGGAGFAKVQVPGPASGLRDARAQAVAYAQELNQLGIQPLVFIDEPMLSAGAAVKALLPLRDAIRETGALVGLHCCGNADWAQVLAADFDVVSFDARLSLKRLVEEGIGDSGAWLALGIVPTTGEVDVDEVCAEVEATLEPALFARVLLTPACGLGLVESPGRLLGALRHAQSRLRRVASRPNCDPHQR